MSYIYTSSKHSQTHPNILPVQAQFQTAEIIFGIVWVASYWSIMSLGCQTFTHHPNTAERIPTSCQSWIIFKFIVRLVGRMHLVSAVLVHFTFLSARHEILKKIDCDLFYILTNIKNSINKSETYHNLAGNSRHQLWESYNDRIRYNKIRITYL